METDNTTAGVARPHTVTVLGLLAGVALIFSYLGAYAMANALVSAEVIAPWTSDHDPRLRWFVKTFCGLMGAFLLMGGLARFASWRQLRTIDQMEDAENP